MLSFEESKVINRHRSLVSVCAEALMRRRVFADEDLNLFRPQPLHSAQDRARTSCVVTTCELLTRRSEQPTLAGGVTLRRWRPDRSHEQRSASYPTRICRIGR